MAKCFNGESKTGKLTAVVRHLLSGADNGFNTTIAHDMDAFGLTNTQHGQQILSNQLTDTYIWDCNVNILTLFMHATTQLRTSFGGVVGLDYTAVKCIADAMDIAWNTETVQGVQACEQVLLEVVNKA